MVLGDIFREKFSKVGAKITLADIKKHTSKSLKYKSYATPLVSKRGNVFRNKNLDIDDMVDKSLQKPLVCAR